MRHRLLLLAVLAFIVAPQSSAAAASAGDVTTAVTPATSLSEVPEGFSITVAQAMTVAETSPAMGVIHRTEHPLNVRVYVAAGSHYEVFFGFHGRTVGDVIVGASGRLGKTYTGALITDDYARGHYSSLFDSPWVWLPFGIAFLLPFVDLRRRRPGLGQLDLVALLSFGVSYALFNAAHVDAAIWSFYPPLLYLLVRMLSIGLRPQTRSRTLDGGLPVKLLSAGLALLVGARIALAFGAGQVLDVGYASVIGAGTILHGHSLYYASSAHLDTYGPIAYLVYVPFDAIWPWQHSFHYLPAARVGAIFLDLATTGSLVLFGRRHRVGPAGTRLGLLLAWGWAANPFTLLALVDSTNDSLLALLAVLALLALSRPAARGAIIGLAAAAKFFPGMLLALLAVGRGDGDRRRALTVVGACAVVAFGSIAIFLPPGGLSEFYNHTIGWQFSRPDVFSLWSLHPTLDPVKYLLIAFAVALALGLAVRPRGPRSVVQVSALAAAVTIAVQLPGVHWFYYYIDWFLPLVLIALLCGERESAATPPGPSGALA